MLEQLRYGTDATVDLDVAGDAVVARCVRALPAIADVLHAVQAALENPIQFPPLRMATTPGDRVTLAFDYGVPSAAPIAVGIIEVLLENGIHPEDITVLLGSDRSRADAAARREFMHYFEDALSQRHRDLITVQTHDATDRNQLSYLAASEDGMPIYLNRALIDADVVVPISTVQLSGALRYLGVYSGLFPVFSDEETIARFFAPAAANQRSEQAKRKAECDEAAWLLGALFAVQIVPGTCGTALQIIAGEARSVEQRGQQLAEEAWVFRTPRRASLVVATIGGGQEQQSWLDFARALSAASDVAEEEGMIVLCTELRCRPGPSLKRLIDQHGDNTATRRRIQKDTTPDAISADTLSRALEHSRVFLLSQLDSEVVEDLGIGYVSDPHEIQRLCHGQPSLILLQDAHRALVRTSPEASEVVNP